ncbi:hypothetical protein KDD30_19095 (plasmid) [Photobacterium sp. GJ3]|uniref:hypothetical protein n=1 Tax=Photobacterium sp. GJ3 TaxID=2829502 RepID=UPI001B8D24BF|nr:hypothetical protein [Photobacterium sp. GJ3]QUJ70231.1 hypothetical protein KDD30_19095 [Photobacterium sp. GJ3]
MDMTTQKTRNIDTVEVGIFKGQLVEQAEGLAILNQAAVDSDLCLSLKVGFV